MNEYWVEAVTTDYIAFHAAARPDAVAVSHRGRLISYAALNRTLRAMMRSLSDLSLPQGSRVAIAYNDIYGHLLLLLAFERLGIATTSFQPIGDDGFRRIPSFFDLIVTESQCRLGSTPYLAVTKDWLERAMARPDVDQAMPPIPPDNIPTRLLCTSGTTGTVKWLQIPRRAHEAMINERIRNFAITRRSQYLFTMPFHVRAVFEFISACLRAGGAIVCADRDRWLGLMSSAVITHAILLPTVLAQLLEELPANFEKPAELTLLTFGAQLPPSLRKRSLARLATNICDIYGTIEVGSICESWREEDRGFGTLLPKAEAEVVDEQGALVTPGTPGRIRVRTAFMSDGYLYDPERTRHMFRDGWFYPGDIGLMDDHGRLRVLGRTDDMLNIGGRKYLPAVLEELIRAEVSVDDVGVSSLPNQQGIEQLWIGVAAAHLNEAEAAERIGHVLARHGIDAAEVRRLDRIPRSASGKILRDLLKHILAAAAGGKA